jgi:hypothetical protein
MACRETDHPLTPKGRWVQGRAKEAELFGEAFENTPNISQPAMAERFGMHHTRIGHMCDPERSNVSVPIRVLWMGGKVGDALWDLISSLRGGRKRDHFGNNHLGRWSYVAKELADVSQEYAAALADGTVDVQERAKLRKEIAEARTALDAIAESLEVPE